MTHKTFKLVRYEQFLAEEFPAGALSETALATELDERNACLADFPHSVLLALAYPELDFAMRWCWEQFGPADGPCTQIGSAYPACALAQPHEHRGRWRTRWLAKTDYDFGCNEWYFALNDDRVRFVQFLPQLNWGEHYPR